MLLLAAEILAAGLVVLGLYRLRRQFGLSLLFIFVGANQFVQNLVSATVYHELLGRFPVSPGSAALFASTLFALLLIYLEEDVPTTRRLIYGIIFANLTVSGVVAGIRFGLVSGALREVAAASDWFLTYDLWLHALGTVLLLIDGFLLLVVFEFLAARTTWLPRWANAVLSLCVVLSFDSVAFVTLGLRDLPEVDTLLIGQLLGKNLAGVIYGLLLSAYLALSRDSLAKESTRARDPFSIFTYRDRYWRLWEEKQELERTRDLERQRTEVAARGAGLGLWDWDVQTGETVLDETWAQMLGYELAEIVPRIDSWRERVHPADRVRVEEALGAHLKGAIPTYEVEQRLRTKSGGWKWILSIGKVIERDEEGRPSRMSGAHLDIDRRKRAEMALRESEHRYELATAAAGVGVWDWNLETDDIYLDPRLKGLLGYQDHEIQNRLDDWGRHVHPEDAEVVMAEATAHIEGRKPYYEIEHRMLHKDGSIRWFLAQGTVLREPDGEPARMIGTDTDITKAKAAEIELAELEGRYRELFEQAPMMYVITSHDEGIPRIDDCNVAFLEALGYERQEIVGRQLADFYTEASRAELLDKRGYRRALEGSVIEGERQLVTKNGDIVEAMLRALPQRNAAGEIVGTRAIYMDLTDRKRAETELERSREQLRRLAARLEAIREEERTLLGREIHDELGQALTGLKMDVAWIGQRLSDRENELAERLQSMASLIDQTIQDVRDLSARLRPVVLDDLGLSDAIDWQARDFSRRFGIECHVQGGEKDLTLDRDKNTAVFRILQEALTNVVRHANALRVDVVLRRAKGRLILEVKDDGRGITPGEASADSALGLLGMRERAEMLGGTFRIASEQGQGTRVVVEIPL